MIYRDKLCKQLSLMSFKGVSMKNLSYTILAIAVVGTSYAMDQDSKSEKRAKQKSVSASVIVQPVSATKSPSAWAPAPQAVAPVPAPAQTPVPVLTPASEPVLAPTLVQTPAHVSQETSIPVPPQAPLIKPTPEEKKVSHKLLNFRTIADDARTNLCMRALDQFAKEFVVLKGRLPDRFSEFFEQNKSLLAGYFATIRPQVTLIGKEDKIRKDLLPNTTIVLETMKGNVEVLCPAENNFAKMISKINNGKVDLTLFPKSGAVTEQKEFSVELPMNANPKSVDIDPKANRLYIGCVDGKVRVYNIPAIANKESEILLQEIARQDDSKSEVKFIKKFNDDLIIVRYSDDSVWLWNEQINEAPLRLPAHEHRKNYIDITNGHMRIIQSHAVKGLTSNIGITWWEGDFNYTIPGAWQDGRSPRDQEEKYFLHRVRSVTSREDVDPDDIAALKYLPLVELFNREITESILQDLTDKETEVRALKAQKEKEAK